MHLTLGASWGYAVEMSNVKTKAPPLETACPLQHRPNRNTLDNSSLLDGVLLPTSPPLPTHGEVHPTNATEKLYHHHQALLDIRYEKSIVPLLEGGGGGANTKGTTLCGQC